MSKMAESGLTANWERTMPRMKSRLEVNVHERIEAKTKVCSEIMTSAIFFAVHFISTSISFLCTFLWVSDSAFEGIMSNWASFALGCKRIMGNMTDFARASFFLTPAKLGKRGCQLTLI